MTSDNIIVRSTCRHTLSFIILATAVDWTAIVVAAWLTEPPRRLVPLAALGVLLRDVPRPQRRVAADVVLVALGQLDTAGLIVFAHHYPTPMVGVLDRDGLRRIAGIPAV